MENSNTPLTLDVLIKDTFEAFNRSQRGLSFYEIRAAVRGIVGACCLVFCVRLRSFSNRLALDVDIDEDEICDVFNIDPRDRKTTFLDLEEFRPVMGALIMSKGSRYFSDLGFDLLQSEEGLISAEDIVRESAKVGKPISLEKAKSMIQVLGNQDGQLDYEVFCELMAFDGA